MVLGGFLSCLYRGKILLTKEADEVIKMGVDDTVAKNGDFQSAYNWYGLMALIPYRRNEHITHLSFQNSLFF